MTGRRRKATLSTGHYDSVGVKRLGDGCQCRLDHKGSNRGGLRRKLTPEELVETGAGIVGRSTARVGLDVQDSGETTPETPQLSTRDRAGRSRLRTLDAGSAYGTQRGPEGTDIGVGVLAPVLGVGRRIGGYGGSGNLVRLHD